MKRLVFASFLTLSAVAFSPRGQAQTVPAVTADGGASADAETPAAGETTRTEDGGAGEASSPEPPQTVRTVVIVDTAPLQAVRPEAASFVTVQVQRQLIALGYRPVETQTLYAAARDLSLHFPLPVQEFPVLLQHLNVPLGVTVELGAANGFYRATVRVRNLQEGAERVRVVFANQWTLADVIRTTLVQLLGDSPTAVQPTYPTGPTFPNLVLPNLSGVRAAQQRRPAHLHARMFDLSLGGAAAFGLGDPPFINGLVGLRAAFFPFDRFGITASVEYANLRGRDANNMEVRRHNVLPMLGIETAVELFRIGTRGRRYVSIPLRLEVGYLPYNGAVVRATGAVSLPITSDIRAEIDLLQPTIWFLPGVTVFSFNLGASLVVGFGKRPTVPTRNTTSPSGTETTTETGSTQTPAESTESTTTTTSGPAASGSASP